jgi:hypothetical protein
MRNIGSLLLPFLPLAGLAGQKGETPLSEQTCSAAFDGVEVDTRRAATDRDRSGCLLDAPVMVWSVSCESRSTSPDKGRLHPLPITIELRIQGVPPPPPGLDAISAMPTAWQDHFEGLIEQAHTTARRTAIESTINDAAEEPSTQAMLACDTLKRRLAWSINPIDEAFWATQSPAGCPRIARLDAIPLPATAGEVFFERVRIKRPDRGLPTPP